MEAGREGRFQWERRVALVPVPEELTPAPGPQPRLYALSVAVRWGSNRTLELASLRTVAGRRAMTADAPSPARAAGERDSGTLAPRGRESAR